MPQTQSVIGAETPAEHLRNVLNILELGDVTKPEEGTRDLVVFLVSDLDRVKVRLRRVLAQVEGE